MSRVALGALAGAIALTGFGWWGTNTSAGRRRFDEMSGIIPTLAYYAGLGISVIALIWLIISNWRSRG